MQVFQDYPLQTINTASVEAERLLVAARKQMINNGYSVGPARGKFGTTGWGEYAKYGAALPTHSDVEAWSAPTSSKSTAFETAIHCTNVAVIDIDFNTTESSVVEVLSLFKAKFPGKALYSAGSGYHVKIFVKADGPMPIWTAAFNVENGRHCIDVRGNGAIAIAYGFNPKSNTAYRWIAEEGQEVLTPLNTPVDELIELSADDIAEFFEEVAELFGGFAEGTTSRGGGGTGGSENILRDGVTGLIVDGRETHARNVAFSTVDRAARDGREFDQQAIALLVEEAVNQFSETVLLSDSWADPRHVYAVLKEKVHRRVRDLESGRSSPIHPAEQANAAYLEANPFLNQLMAGHAIQLDTPEDIFDGVQWLIEGTPAETFLMEATGLERPAWGWPNVVGWHEQSQSIYVRLNGDSGAAAAVYNLAFVDFDAQRVKDLVCQHLGDTNAQYTHLKGAGRSVVVEGLASALSIWCSTGRNVYMTTDHVARVGGDLLDNAIAALPDDAAVKGAYQSRHHTVTGMLDDLRRSGKRFAAIRPRKVRSHDSSTFADLSREEGTEAVVERIMYADSVLDGKRDLKTVTIEQAREATSNAVQPWADAVFEGRNDCRLVRTDAGVGKTETLVQLLPQMVREARAQGKEGAILFAMPTHKVMDGTYNRFLSACGDDVTVDVYYGREAINPDTGKAVCLDIAENDDSDAAKAMNLNVNVNRAVCQTCPHREVCPFLAQEHKQADIWVVSHAFLKNYSLTSHGMPFSDILAIIVDEDPTESWLAEYGEHYIDQLSNPILKADEDGSLQGNARSDDHLNAYRQAASAAFLNLPNGFIKNSELLAGIQATWKGGFGFPWFAQQLEIERKYDAGEIKSVAVEQNRDWRWSVAVAKAIEDAVRQPNDYNRFLHIKPTGEGRKLVASQLIPINPDWLKRADGVPVPILFLDATPALPFLKVEYPDLKVVDTGLVETPYATIRQDFSRRYGQSAYKGLKDGLLNENQRKQQNTAENKRSALASTMTRIAMEHGSHDNFAILNKEVKEKIQNERPGIEGRFAMLHHKSTRGVDEYKNAPVGFVVGRPLPDLVNLKMRAGALSGRLTPEMIDAKYKAVECLRHTPEGAFVSEDKNHLENEYLRTAYNQCVFGEIKQGLARARPTNRTEDNPATIYILGDAVLDMPVEEVDMTGNEHPVFDMMATANMAVVDSPEQASKFFPELFKNERAFRNAVESFEQNPVKTPDFCGKSQVRSKQGSHDGFLIESYIRKPSPLRLFDLTFPGQGQKAFQVLVDTLAHEGRDPVDVIRERFGDEVKIKEIKFNLTTGERVADMDQDELREQVKSFITSRDISKSAVARSIDVDQSNFSKWLDGKRKKLPEDSVAKLVDWIDGEGIESSAQRV